MKLFKHLPAGRLFALAATLLATHTLTACNRDEANGAVAPRAVSTNALLATAATPTQPSGIDYRCDNAPFPSIEWTQCELTNFARTTEAPREQLQPAFITRSVEQSASNFNAWTSRVQNDPSLLLSRALNAPVLPPCNTGQGPCLGDPFAYPEADGPNGKTFYQTQAKVTPVIFYDRDCSRLSGRVWVPRTAAPDSQLPHVIFVNGSIQAPQAVYVPFIQAYVRAGYAVLTFDPRGQGQSDQQSPNFKQGSNLGPEVFWENLVDAIDFMHSNPSTPYPHHASCKATYPTQTAAFNPAWRQIDTQRLGIAGHSLGAIGISVVQGYGAPGADPWPGKLSSQNPVKAAVALDSLMTPDGRGVMPVNCARVDQIAQLLTTQIGAAGRLPKFGIQVPSMSFSADYCAAPTPYLTPPDAAFTKTAFREWQTAKVPVYALTIQGTTHFDFSPSLAFPATSWCPDASSGACRDGWAMPAINHYSVAWFDRWLKNPGERGFEDADQRLIDDAGPQGAVKMSFRYQSARDFADRSGKTQRCENIRRGCP